MQNQDAEHHLLSVLKARGIPLGQDDVAWAFASSQTREDMVNWVEEYLQEENLLTRNELSLYRKISSSTKSTQPTETAIAIHDDQLAEALESLRTSTSLIEEHTRVLQKQREALEALQGRNLNRATVSTSESPSRQRNGHSRQYDFSADETTIAVQESFDSAFKQSSKAKAALVALTTERLGADDEVLAALSKLAPKAMPRADDGPTLGKIEQWTKALTVMREQEANARIDTMIDQNVLELLDSGQQSADMAASVRAEDIESELKSLRDEIGSVVELVVGSEFRQPLTRLLRTSQKQSHNSQHEWLEYILATMEHMIRQMDEMSSCAEDIRSYNSTLAEIRDSYIATTGEGKPSTDSGHDTTTSDTLQTDSRHGTANASANTNMTEQVFRRFAIPGRATVEALLTASNVAKDKLQDQYASISSTTAKVVSQSMEEQRRELQTILKQLYAFSNYASVELLPQDVDAAVQGLDNAISETVLTLSSAESGKHEDVRRGIAKLRARLDSK